MTLFNIRKEDLDMLKRKIDRYLADWSNEQDRNSDLNIACRKRNRGCVINPWHTPGFTMPITFSHFLHLLVLASFLMEYAFPSSPCQNRLPFPDISWRDHASLLGLHADCRVPEACLA